MLSARRTLALALAAVLAGFAAPGAVPAARAAAARPASAVPSGAWAQFQSDIAGVAGLATGRGVTVAILSSGVDTSAPGLAGRSAEGPDYAFAPREPLAHSLGTLTASLIVGAPGVVQGIAPGVRILGIRVQPDGSEHGAATFDKNEFGSNAANTGELLLARAITYAVVHGARVIEIVPEISHSVTLDPQFAAAVTNAIRRNVIFVVPDGDAEVSPTRNSYPAVLPGVIGVASVMLPGGVSPSVVGYAPAGTASYDNNSVAISGPGDWIRGTADFWGLYGTPAAAAYVAGTAALIRQLHPAMPPALVEQALAMSARDRPAGGYSTAMGFGVLDPYLAVLDADKLAKETMTAAPGTGVTAAGAHFGTGPVPGVIDALPPAGPALYWYWAAIGAGALFLLLAAGLAVRSGRRRLA